MVMDASDKGKLGLLNLKGEIWMEISFAACVLLLFTDHAVLYVHCTY